MMRLNSFFGFLRTSLFDIRYSAVRFGTLILLVLTLLFLTRQVALAQSSSGAKALLEKADRCADTLLQSKDKKKLRHKWTECVDDYRNVASRFPQSEKTG